MLLIRLISFGIFVCCSVVISLHSLLAFTLFLGLVKLNLVDFTYGHVVRSVSTGTVYLAGNDTSDQTTEINPFSRRKGVRKNEEELIMTKTSAYIDKIVAFVSYDAATSEILDHFAPVQQNTECIFARTSKIWGARPFIDTLSIGMNGI